MMMMTDDLSLACDGVLLAFSSFLVTYYFTVRSRGSLKHEDRLYMHGKDVLSIHCGYVDYVMDYVQVMG